MKKYISSLLICLLLVTQTIRIDFFIDHAEARAEDYRSIVSLIVDRDTYDIIRTKIHRYADDIQKYLWSTRTAILVVDRGTHPAQIATQNEALYYEGDGGEGKSHLVGTIIIGNVPLPTVFAQGQIFTSLYPYVDFDDKTFVYNSETHRYERSSTQNEGIDIVDIWHGVINPALGREWEGGADIAMIGSFLDKTHDFYTQSNVFSADAESMPPKVFYYDGFIESRSLSAKKALQYTLFIEHAETLAYRRYSQEFLQMINERLSQFDRVQRLPEEQELLDQYNMGSHDTGLSPDDIENMPVAHTIPMINTLLGEFHEISNKKVLGDHLAAVRNAGRYNSGSTVRVDIPSVNMSVFDQGARDVIRAANDTIEAYIDEIIRERKMARKIPVYETLQAGFGENESQGYTNYYFGTPGSQVLQANRCHIGRGGTGGVIVEANAAFDVRTVEEHNEHIRQDMIDLQGACMENGRIKIRSYWGDNSILRLVGTEAIGTASWYRTFPETPIFRWITQPIFSLWGMRESNRLWPPSVMHCVNDEVQYTLRNPTFGYPSELWQYGVSPARFTCISQVSPVSRDALLNPEFGDYDDNPANRVVPLLPRDFFEEIDRYDLAPCLIGKITLDNEVIRERDEQCTNIDDESESVRRDIRYHTIEGILHHTSPTDEEIEAAEVNGMTYSLPIDVERSIEFITPKGNHAVIKYPNLFQTPATTIDDMRVWIDQMINTQWNEILTQERNTPFSDAHVEIAREYLDAVPLIDNPPVWSSALSDELLTEVLRAKNWLNPDIANRHQDIVERMLSYSGEHPQESLYDRPPQLVATPRQDYEIAYLGLMPLDARLSRDGGAGLDGNTNGDDAFLDEYQRLLATLQGLRISDGSSRFDLSGGLWEIADTHGYEWKPGWNSSGWDTQCGPIDGVMIWQWPQAILCWIQKELPPKVFPSNQCGIWHLSSGENILDMISIPSWLSSADQRAWYQTSRISTDMHRRTLGPNDSITIRSALVRDDGRVMPHVASEATLHIDSVVAWGETIAPEYYDEYFAVSPEQWMPIPTGSAHFLFQSHGRSVSVQGRIVYTVRVDSGDPVVLSSEPLEITVHPSYIEFLLEQGGNPVQSIESQGTWIVTLKAQSRDNVSWEVTPITDFSLRILDDITWQEVIRDEIQDEVYILPSSLVQTPWVYRAVLQASSWWAGEMVFSVRSGTLGQIELLPASPSVVRWGETLITLALQDAQGSAITPYLHRIVVEVEWGTLLDAQGNTTNRMQIDMVNAFTTFTVRATDTSDIQIRVSEAESNISAQTRIRVFPSAQLKLHFEDVAGGIRAGGSDVQAQIRIVDERNIPIPGFSSVASWSMPSAAWKFDQRIVPITNGVSEIFLYTPGYSVGTHHLSLTIPGIGNLTDIPITIWSADPVYIDHSIEGNQIIFVARDRYGNRTDYNGQGTIRRGTEPDEVATFLDGVYTTSRQGWYYVLRVPEIDNTIITYQDGTETREIRGLGHYQVYIPHEEQSFRFYPDYNARYTVLAGGSFLREAEDILYHQTPGQSQSLAVSTLLETPYTRESVLTVFPGGGYSLGEPEGMLLSAEILIERGYPLVVFFDELQWQEVARILYKMNNADLFICNTDDPCIWDNNRILARATESRGGLFTWKERGTKLYLERGTIPVFSIDRNGVVESTPGVTFTPVIDSDRWGMVFHVLYQGWVVWEVEIQTDARSSVIIENDVFQSNAYNTPIISLSRFSALPFSDRWGVQGYRIETTSPVYEQLFDPIKNSPLSDDALGVLDAMPGIGWQGNNRLLLSYAAGDTVGEASKWFHTYTFVNLGDPVAHVTRGRIGTQVDGIDRTIGTQIASSARSPLLDFRRSDMNQDWLDDIITIASDGYLELFLNLWGSFRSRGKIAYIADIRGTYIRIGDFQWDGYGDILGINADGSLVLITNNEGQFSRRLISVDNGVFPEFVSQIEVYDMDADGRDDIVYLTSTGELWILYGTDTPWTFSANILDATLGITLHDEVIRTGWALYGSTVPQIDGVLGVNPIDTDGISDTMIQAEVYYQHTDFSLPRDADVLTPDDIGNIIENDLIDVDSDFLHAFLTGGTHTGTLIRPTNGNSWRMRTFIRSQYAEIVDVDIAKTHQSISGATLVPGWTIESIVTIKNNGNTVIRGVEYLDTILAFFSEEDTETYTVEIDGYLTERSIESLMTGDYDLIFRVGDIPPGATAIIRFPLKVLPASYGEMIVGDLERGRSSHDLYGDIAFRTSTTCGADRLEWLSSWPRTYTRGVGRSLQATYADSLPDWLADTLADANNNGIPDSMENMSIADRESAYNALVSESERRRNLVNIERRGNTFDIDFDRDVATRVEGMMDDIFNGLACWFGGWSCMSFPINWAPLAPGNDPVVFGMPIGDGFLVREGIPIFSSLTGMPVYGPWGCYAVPTVWPISPIALEHACTTNYLGAGGYLGVESPANVIRVFVTPTLTLGMGAAVCMGWPAISPGWFPPPGLFPLVQWGNCIVMTKPMPLCRSDGSVEDGDVRYFAGNYAWWSQGGSSGGLGWGQTGGLGVEMDTWNAASCKIQIGESSMSTDVQTRIQLERDIIAYMRNPQRNLIPEISVRLSQRGVSSLNTWPLVRISGWSGWGTELDISLVGTQNIADTRLVNVRNRRIAAFPDFLMDWLTRQVEEFTNAFFTPPNLTIIPPTDFGQNMKIDQSYADFLDQLDAVSVRGSSRDLSTQMFPGQNINQTDSTWPSVMANGLNSLRAAYTFIAKLPFITLDQRRIPINVPWITMRELNQYERQIHEYMQTIDRTLQSWCISDPTPECLAQKASLQSGAFRASLMRNLQRIEEYRNFPEKLQKYVTWKQHYLYQIVCNIEKLQEMIGGWIYTNGIRFQKWAELFVLIKAIASSWQPLIDIFANMHAQCGVCRNERYNAQYWKFKLLSMLLPNIPIIRFPRWPDIILDLSDIRLGLRISIPDFDFQLNRLRLPRLPHISLPSAPNVSVRLPALPVLPPLPDLPDLPDLPTIPTIVLPNLPPPPKLPKLSGSIQAMLRILRLIAKMYCYYQNTMLIPEWQVGDVIAQRTERQGVLPMDFLNVHFPDITIPGIKEIRVSTHLNLELTSDFLVEFAEAAVRPINRFTNDIQSLIPTRVGNDVHVPSPIPGGTIPIDIPAPWQGSIQSLSNMITSLVENDGDVFLDTDEFYTYLRSELLASDIHEGHVEALDRMMQLARMDATKIRESLEHYTDEKFQALHQIIEHEYVKTGELQKVIDTLRSDNTHELLSFEYIAPLVSDTSWSDALVDSFYRLQETDVNIPSSALSSLETSLDDMKTSLEHRVHRIAQNAIQPVDIPSLSNMTNPYWSSNMYTPRFEGIYTITSPSQIQTRLFDYTEPVRADTRVDTVDIDLDGDKDYIYILDGALFVKRNFTLSPPHRIDTASPRVIAVDSNGDFPVVPNYFHETVVTPTSLNLSFRPASLNDTTWRLEFFDGYLDWDRLAIGWASSESKVVMDFMVDTASSTTDNTTQDNTTHSYTAAPVMRSLVRGADHDGFRLESGQLTVLTGSIYISLSPGRSLYTGNARVPIFYKNATVSGTEMMILEPNMRYEFDTTTEIRAERWPLFIIEPGRAYQLTARHDDLIGMPILPGMRLFGAERLEVRDHITNSILTLSPETVYATYSLGPRADHYNIRVPYPNGFYYARLHTLSQSRHDRAGVALFTPQAASDESSPVVTLSEYLRIPVYTTRAFSLNDIVTEMSDYTVAVDPNTAQDENGNGISDDDFVRDGDGVSVTNDTLTIGSFTEPWRRSMRIVVRDEFGNTTYIPLNIEIYTPIPSVTEMTASGIFHGQIEEPIMNEPIHLWRLRHTERPTLLHTDPFMTDNMGQFMTESFEWNDEIITVSSSGHTWNVFSGGALSALPPNYTLSVTGSNTHLPMTLSIRDGLDRTVYEQWLVLPRYTTFFTDIPSDLTQTGVFLSTNSNVVEFVRAQYNDPNIPSGYYLVADDRTPLAVLSRDGNISILDPSISLSAANRDDFLEISIHRNGVLLAQIWYRIHFFFVER